jgi:hypothetical protein
MKTLVFAFIVFAAIFGANRCSHKMRSHRVQALDSTLTIEYKNTDDLLAQLKRVPTGQKVELKCTGSSTESFNTGLRCGTPEAEAATQRFFEKTERKNTEINRELKRIQKLP